MRVEKGRFKEKHPSEAVADPEIAQAVRQKVVNGMVTCADAETVHGLVIRTLARLLEADGVQHVGEVVGADVR